MIAVDTSALKEILLEEGEAANRAAALSTSDQIVISAGTLAETLIVANHPCLGAEMTKLIDSLDIKIADISQSSARRAADACAKRGKGRHPAGLNFGDCFAYDLAIAKGRPLLYVGADFEQTGVASAI